MNTSVEAESFVVGVPEAYVDRGFEMDPTEDDLIFGSDLKVGMVVLLEDGLMRDDQPRDDAYSRARYRETSRWCQVERFHAPREDVLTFIGLYADGTKRARMYNRSYAWFVKKASIVA